MAGFGISETQTRSELPSRLSSQLLLSLSLRVCFALSGFTTYRMEELARRCFKGLSPFSLLTSVAVQMLLRDLGNDSHPAPFQTTGGGNDKHSPHPAAYETKHFQEMFLRKNGKRGRSGWGFIRFWSAWRSGLADLGWFGVSEGERKDWAELTVSVSRCYPVELTYTGIIIKHSAFLSLDSEDNLDSRGKILKQLATNLVLQCTCIQYLPPALGLFPPLLSFPLLLLLLFPLLLQQDPEPTCLKKEAKKKAGFVGRVWQWVPKSTLSFSFGKLAANFSGAVPRTPASCSDTTGSGLGFMFVEKKKKSNNQQIHK